MVRHANETVPFYMELYQCYQDAIEQEEFSKLPATNKDMYVYEGEGALSMEYLGEYLKGDLLWARTCNDAGTDSCEHRGRLRQRMITKSALFPRRQSEDDTSLLVSSERTRKGQIPRPLGRTY